MESAGSTPIGADAEAHLVRPKGSQSGAGRVSKAAANPDRQAGGTLGEPAGQSTEQTSASTAILALPPPEPPAQTGSLTQAHALRGLCQNCSRRHTCDLPKPEGGVWRCDEYE